MSVINFEPTWITRWEFIDGSYEAVGTGEPFYISSSTVDDINRSAMFGFDYEALIDVINRSASAPVVFFGLNVTDNPARWIQIAFHQDSEQQFEDPGHYFTTGIQMDVDLGDNSVDITNVVNLGNRYTFLEAWRDLGYRGIRIYKSGHTSTPGIIEAENAQIIIEGDWEINSPTPRSLRGGVSHNVGEPAVFEWTHNGSFDQTEFDLRYRPAGASSWTTVTESTSSQSYTLPANELALGEYEWQVRTRTDYDYQSAWSSLSTFTVAELPATPVITRPVEGEEIGISDLYVEWEADDQFIYELELLDESGNLVANAGGQVPHRRDYTFEDVLDNHSDYKVRLRVAVSGLYSAWAEVDFSVSYTEPAKPELVFISDHDKSTITVYIENPTPTGTQPNVLYQDLYRVDPSGEVIRIAKDLNPNDFFIDFTPAGNKQYEYYVRMFGENEVNVNSDRFYASVKVKKTLISIANKPDELIRLEIVRSRSTGKNYNSTTRNFSGRKLPVTEFGETLEGSIDIQCLVKPSEFDMLNNLIDRNETLLYRDSRGRKKYVTISDISVTDEFKKFFSVELPLTEVDYNEAIE